MSGRSPPLYCTLILITMHSHQSYSNITTVIHSYEYSPTVDNSKMYTSILYNFLNRHADSHVQLIIVLLATEETTVTQQVSHRPIKCQSRLWSQGGTKVKTGYIMVTTRYSDQQGSKSRQKVMRLYKQRHRPLSKRFIKPHY